MSTLDIGLIGCGRVAQRVHLPILTGLPQARLVAIAESDPQQREEVGRHAGTAIVAEYEALLDMPKVEAVVVCVPSGLHAEVAVAALDRGKHVYLEKPLATTWDEARSVLSALERSGTVGMIGFNYRFNRAYLELKRCLQSGEYGEWVAARTVLAAPEETLPDWKRRRESGGGALLDQASHHFDLMRFLFEDEIRDVTAQVRSQRSESDTATVQVQLANGLAIQSFLSINTVNEDRFEVYTEKARLSVDRYRSPGVEIATDSRSIPGLRGLRSGLDSLKHAGYILERYRAPGREPSFRSALAHFVEAISEGRPPSPSFRDGYLSLAAVLAAEESARSGHVVGLNGGTRPV
ncbi:MAG: Gfo/Idh/MocA family oxidoreductase [Gemmatimonadetes bacterium]|nr:Gfo/Idh/MocA family oxidoreductase [Gemmatimonadota bacterium]